MKIRKIFIFFVLFFFSFLLLSQSQIRAQASTGNFQNIINLFRKYQQNRTTNRNQDWEEVKNEYNQLKKLNLNVSSEFQQKEQEILNRAKERFTEFADRIIKHLEELKLKIQDEDLPAQTKNRIIAYINKMISYVNQKKTEVNNAQTIDELRAIASEIREYWEENKIKAKAMAMYVVISRLESTAGKVDELYEKAIEKLAQLEKLGFNTDQAEKLLDEAIADLQKTEAELRTAKDYFDQVIYVNGDLEYLFDEGKKHLEYARAYLREAIEKIKQALKLLREQIPSVMPSGFPTAYPPDGGKPSGIPTGVPPYQPITQPTYVPTGAPTDIWGRV